MTAGVGLVIHLASRVRELRSPYLRTLLAGTAALFGVEVLWSLLSNSGIGPVPVTGVNFPFLSYGGSLMVVHLGLIGIALGAYRRRTLAS
jgi:cell division protein FtsW (lipid II flippase)